MKDLSRIDRDTKIVWLAFTGLLVWLILVALASFLAGRALILLGLVSGVVGLIPIILFFTVQRREWNGLELIGLMGALCVAVISLSVDILVLLGYFSS